MSFFQNFEGTPKRHSVIQKRTKNAVGDDILDKMAQKFGEKNYLDEGKGSGRIKDNKKQNSFSNGFPCSSIDFRSKNNQNKDASKQVPNFNRIPAFEDQDKITEDNQKSNSYSGVSIQPGISPQMVSSFIPNRSMRPQVHKREKIVNDSAGEFADFQTPLLDRSLEQGAKINRQGKNRREKNKQEQTEVKPLTTDKITAKPDYVQIRKSHQLQLEMHKDCYEGQISFLKHQLEQLQRQNQAHNRQIEVAVQDQRIKSQRLFNQEKKRMIDLNSWELKKKTQSYENEIYQLKALIEKISEFANKEGVTTLADRGLELRAKQRQLVTRERQVSSSEQNLHQRERQLQRNQDELRQQKKSIEDQLMEGKKSLARLEADLNQRQLELRRAKQIEQQNQASQLAKAHLEIEKMREQAKIQLQQVRLQKQLFDRQKTLQEEFNQRIVDDYREKLRQIESQRDQINKLQIETHQKMQDLSIKAFAHEKREAQNRKSTSQQFLGFSKEAFGNKRTKRIQSQIIAQLKNTKNRYQDLEGKAGKQKNIAYNKKNFAEYVNKLNRTSVDKFIF